MRKLITIAIVIVMLALLMPVIASACSICSVVGTSSEQAIKHPGSIGLSSLEVINLTMQIDRDCITAARAAIVFSDFVRSKVNYKIDVLGSLKSYTTYITGIAPATWLKRQPYYARDQDAGGGLAIKTV